MTLYAGETIRVHATADDFDDTPLIDTDVSNVKVSIYTPDLAAVVTDISMTYTTGEGWAYLWNSSTTPGDYQAKVVLNAIDGGKSIEWRRIRLVPNLV